MSGKLKVQELRDALASRGLDTAGLKPDLVARLDAAIAKEEEEEKKKNKPKESKGKKRKSKDEDSTTNVGKDEGKAVVGDSVGKGRNKLTKRAAEDVVDADAHPSKQLKVMDVESMSVAELRDALSDRALATTGSKKTLQSRLISALEKDGIAGDANLEDDNEETTKEEKLVVVTKKGRAVLDSYLPDTIKSSCHVLESANVVYDAMLNQTNVGDNNNKFYVIQALESDTASAYYVYFRWGRVGVRGQDNLAGPYYDKWAATSEFEAKFYDKTKNHWSDRHNFQAYPKKYTWIERDYEQEEAQSSKTEKSKAGDKKVASISKTPKETKLDKRLESFISCICNMNMMKQQMMEIGYDANKMPLGKLSKSTILKGYEVLKKLSAVLEGSQKGSLEQLSSEFYTVIPHDFGFQKMRNFVIDTYPKLKKKIEMVEALGEIELATKLLGGRDEEEEDDPAFVHYKRLKCDLEPLDKDGDDFNWIKQYISNTHAETHSGYTLELLEVFRAHRHGEDEHFKKFSVEKNRMLLWHGSRLTNWTGILSQGLRIAPPEAPVTGYMFGKGVYFADMVSKSANYCYTSRQDPIGVLLLCEVALGEMQELLQSNYHADKLPPGKLSTKGVGHTYPNPKDSKVLADGVVVPMGKGEKVPTPGASLLYNEYIVYNVEQIRMRYVLQVKFNYQNRW